MAGHRGHVSHGLPLRTPSEAGWFPGRGTPRSSPRSRAGGPCAERPPTHGKKCGARASWPGPRAGGRAARRVAVRSASARRASSGTNLPGDPQVRKACGPNTARRNTASRGPSRGRRLRAARDVTAPRDEQVQRHLRGKKPCALSAQIGKSQLIAHSKPPPTAQPLMAPTTGLAPNTIASVARWIASTISRASSSVSGVDMGMAVVARAKPRGLRR